MESNDNGSSITDDVFLSLEVRLMDPEFLEEHLDAYRRSRTEMDEAYAQLCKRIRRRQRSTWFINRVKRLYARLIVARRSRLPIGLHVVKD